MVDDFEAVRGWGESERKETIMSNFLDKIIPKEPVPATVVNPRCCLWYSDFKVGKSWLSHWASLNRNALWLDYEDGGEALSGIKINVVKEVKGINAGREEGRKISKVQFVMRLLNDLAAEHEAGKPRFQYVIHDKIDTIEEWCELWATAQYRESVIGKSFKGSSVLELPDGAGYLPLRLRFLDFWNVAVSAAPSSIFLASMRVNRNTGKDGTSGTVTWADLDLTKGIRKIAAGQADAPGIIWRQSEGVEQVNYISFKSGDKGGTCGCRIQRLEGKMIKLTVKNEQTGVITAPGWDQIFLPSATGIVTTTASNPPAPNPPSQSLQP